MIDDKRFGFKTYLLILFYGIKTIPQNLDLL